MNEFSRTQTPPGGWSFYQPQTNWSAPTPVASTFDQTVILIIKHRLANHAILIKHKLSVDVTAVGNELENYTRMRLGIPMAPMPNPQMPPRRLPEAVEGAVVVVRRLAAGAALLFEWQESGQSPVPRELANKRAAICAACPKNNPAHLSRYFTEPVAKMLRLKLTKLHAMNLTTDYDSKLGVCDVCVCPLALKSHSPLDLILKHTNEKTMSEFPDNCWVKKKDQN